MPATPRNLEQDPATQPNGTERMSASQATPEFPECTHRRTPAPAAVKTSTPNSSNPSPTSHTQTQIPTLRRASTATSKLSLDTKLHSQPSTPTVSTPPESPARKTDYLGVPRMESFSSNGAAAVTPPSTPTGMTEGVDYVSEVATPRVLDTQAKVSPHPSTSATGDPEPTSSNNGTPVSESKDKTKTSGNPSENGQETGIIRFPYWNAPYDLPANKRERKLLGQGLWSDVYLVHASLPSSSPSKPVSQTPDIPSDKLPPTPRASLESLKIGTSKNEEGKASTYALKIPASRSAKAVLESEALILSNIARYPDYSSHIVPFFGQDARNGALVMRAMDGSLEGYIKILNNLGEEERRKTVASCFIGIAKGLLEGLEWLGECGIVHGDVKPGNVLLEFPSNSPSTDDHTTSTLPKVPSKVLFTDFSAAILPSTITPSSEPQKRPNAGGGSWDFLSPSLTASPSAPPTPHSDLWALALTLLELVLGSSPYASAAQGNVFRRREFVKLGDPLGAMLCGEDGIRNRDRLRALQDELGWDVQSWFAIVLGKKGAESPSVGEWLDALRKAEE